MGVPPYSEAGGGIPSGPMMSDREHMAYMGGGAMGGYNPGYSVPAQGTSATTMSGYGAGSTGDPSTSSMYGGGMGGGAMQQQPPMGMSLAHQPAPVGMSPQGGAEMSSMMSQFSVQHQQLMHRQQGIASGQQPMGVGQHGLGAGQQRMVPSQLNQLQAQVCKSRGQAVAHTQCKWIELEQFCSRISHPDCRTFAAYVRTYVHSRLLSAAHRTATLNHPTIILIDSTVGLLKINSVRRLPNNFAMSLNSFTPAPRHPCTPSLLHPVTPCTPSLLHPVTPCTASLSTPVYVCVQTTSNAQTISS